ncbi:prenyltransferase/squalene oxidase repeat-containing protein [Desulfobacterota bacterium M19]
MNPFAGIEITRLRNFILNRQKDEGGFAAVPSLPATIQDTFQALEQLSMLDQYSPVQPSSAVNKSGLRQLIGRYKGDESDSLSPRLLYYLTRIAAFAGDNISFSSPQPSADESYENLYFLSRISSTSLPENRQPGRQTWKFCRELYFGLLLKAEAFENFDFITTWLRACQNGDGGFGFFPATTSYIENSHYCLASLAVLGARPENIKTAREYIVSCQTAAGGFARTGKAAPFLDSSWHALSALKALAD